GQALVFEQQLHLAHEGGDRGAVEREGRVGHGAPSGYWSGRSLRAGTVTTALSPRQCPRANATSVRSLPAAGFWFNTAFRAAGGQHDRTLPRLSDPPRRFPPVPLRRNHARAGARPDPA